MDQHHIWLRAWLHCIIAIKLQEAIKQFPPLILHRQEAGHNNSSYIAITLYNAKITNIFLETFIVSPEHNFFLKWTFNLCIIINSSVTSKKVIKSKSVQQRKLTGRKREGELLTWFYSNIDISYIKCTLPKSKEEKSNIIIGYRWIDIFDRKDQNRINPFSYWQNFLQILWNWDCKCDDRSKSGNIKSFILFKDNISNQKLDGCQKKFGSVWRWKQFVVWF